jgi:hypothetical protein
MQNQIKPCPERQSLLQILSDVESLLEEATRDFENHDGMQYYRGRVDALSCVRGKILAEIEGYEPDNRNDIDRGFIDLRDAIEPDDSYHDTMKMTCILSKLDNLLALTSNFQGVSV